MAGNGVLFDQNDMSSWYFRDMSRSEATTLLQNEMENGVFLVRDSRSIIGDFVLCVRERNKVSHYIINRVVVGDGTTMYRIGEKMFADMPSLLCFYRLHYLDSTPLVRPLPRTQTNTVLEVVQAKYDFNARDADDLPFTRGEHLMVISRDEENWWTARNNQGRTGSIPVPYVQRVLDASGQPCPVPEALARLQADPPTPPGGRAPPARPGMQRTLPAAARVRQTRIPSAYDRTALKLEKGDIVMVTKMNINGQWEGELNGKVGFFPFTHVEFIDDPPQALPTRRENDRN